MFSSCFRQYSNGNSLNFLDFRANKPSDIISTLVSIYDSKDLFVKELQVLLAQRLLAINDDEAEKIEREVRPFYFLVLSFHPLTYRHLLR